MTSFAGQHVLVTGASQGIGKGVVEHLLSLGAAVTGTFNASAAEAKQMESDNANLRMLQVNFSHRDSTLKLIDQVRGLGELNGIVNNAGVVEFERWENFTMEAWDRTFEINVNAPLLLCRELGTNMPAGSSVVNIASTDGLTGSMATVAYAASKAALLNLTKSLGNVMAPSGVRVNALSPGWIDTGMTVDASSESPNLVPLGRNGLPAEMATVVAFLLSDEARYVNGANLVADGGYTNVDWIMKQENDSA